MKMIEKKRLPAVIVIILCLVADLFAAGLVVGADYYFSYKSKMPLAASGQVSRDTESYRPWKTKFASHFSNTVISTDTEYKSPDISVTITKNSYDSGIIDKTANGKHKKYGSRIAYTVADIYISDISCIQTAFAEDTYGIGYSEGIASMSKRMKSVLGINGDSYSNRRHQYSGTIIRNGRFYRSRPTTEEICVLYKDGTIKIESPDVFRPSEAIKNGAWQSWVFGPSLLDEKGRAKSDFITWDYITQSHPRTALGYYEPGHYCLVIVDGRQEGYSRGMFLTELSQLFEDLGCKSAYNLDGGHCSFMTKGSSIISHPYRPNKDITDGIFICETER